MPCLCRCLLQALVQLLEHPLVRSKLRCLVILACIKGALVLFSCVFRGLLPLHLCPVHLSAQLPAALSQLPNETALPTSHSSMGEPTAMSRTVSAVAVCPGTAHRAN